MPRKDGKRRRKGPRHAVGAPIELDGNETIDEEEGAPDAEPDSDEAAESGQRRGGGARRSALRKRRRRRTASRVGIGVVVGAVVATALVVGPFLVANNRDAQQEGNGQKGAAPQKPITTLVFGTKERSAHADPEAIWLMLFTYDAKRDEGAAIQIPSHTAAEIPGRGLETFTDAYASGGIPLLLVSVENMLGVPIDRYLELSDRDARVLFSATGPLTVDVPEEVRVPAGRKRVRIVFGSGPQRLAAPFLAKLLYTRGLDADDTDFGARQLAFWDAVFDTFDNDPARLSKSIQLAGPALAESDADTEEHAQFFRALAELPRLSLTLTSLPVRPVAAGKDEIYSTDAEEIRSFVIATFGATHAPEEQIRVQVLNGNGVPGIGQDVAELLIGRGFRVILSGNARRLDYERTLIVAYDRSEEGLALAERAKELLGVGRVQVSAQQQGIVDLTIVIGKDFLSTL